MSNNIEFKYNKKIDIFSVNPNGITLSLVLTQSCNNQLSLKNILKKNLNGAVFIENLNIQITLAENIHVDIIDDLLDFDITKSKLEFVLNFGSTLNYNLEMFNQYCSEGTNDGLLLAYNNQGYIEKELKFKFVGQYSEAKVKCFCKGTENRFFKFKTEQYHQASFTKSELIIKGAFCNYSKIFCDSLIKIDKNTKKVEASQLNKNLLLGCNTRAISIPKLEVKADDVKCKHGAAISKLDEEQLFYLQSRGIDFCQAKEILINAFLS